MSSPRGARRCAVLADPTAAGPAGFPGPVSNAAEKTVSVAEKASSGAGEAFSVAEKTSSVAGEASNVAEKALIGA
jgi:hypothetical protein